MKDGFVRVAAAIPKISVADTTANTEAILVKIREMQALGAKIMVLPELCITGYTCQDLFWQNRLLTQAKEALLQIARETADVDALLFVGLPMEIYGKLFNIAAALCHGEILGLVPKTHIPSYAEFYEGRHLQQVRKRLQKYSWEIAGCRLAAARSFPARLCRS